MGENYKLYRNIFDPSPFLKYINQSKEIAINKRQHAGNNNNGHDFHLKESVPNYTHWDSFYAIDFLLHGHKTKELAEFIEESSKLINHIFNNNLPLHKENFLLFRTNGLVMWHQDNSRTVSLNLGILNSTAAEIDIRCKDNSTESYTMNDGDVCLLNVKAFHTVKSIPGIDRYLLCYNFPTEDYNEISKLIALES